MASAMVEEGADAPAFNLPDQHGRQVSLESLRGSWVVLYFYPKDDTPGCTREACSFRDSHAAIRSAGATVLGVSADSAESHAGFAAKHELPFQLLADSGNTVAFAYGAWGEKNMYGKVTRGIIRSTFIIDPSGKVAKRWARVKSDGHGAQVLAWLEEHAAPR